MAHYRCYFLGRNGRIVQAEDIEAEAASEALQFCRGLCVTSGFFSLELWQAGVRLHKEAVGEAAPLVQR